jgi:1-deoxy-D-xylulose-5-phosphate synthase
MEKILPKIKSPLDLAGLSLPQLEQLAGEMREALCGVVAVRSAHFASNLGVVELCLALHTAFDFRTDRLIWDTGHQIYPHKLITGRYEGFESIRTRGGWMGYPNPAESPYDLFMTGHAGSSVSTMLGLKSGDDLIDGDNAEQERHHVAVIGDGAFPSGIVYEALNNIGGLKKKLLIVLNDNEMSICPRVGGLGDYLDRLRVNPMYTGLKSEVLKVLNKVPVFGDPVERFVAQLKEAAKAGLHGGMLFEELGIQYIGPIDGHNIALMRKYMRMVKGVDGPVLLHVVTEKGHGFKPAAQDPVAFHTPAVFTRDGDRVIEVSKSSSQAYTNIASDAIHRVMDGDERVTVMTAAMCQGNKLNRVRDDYPTRFFDTGICEGHAVAFAAGQAKAGLRPIVDIYSTFLQRSYDQIFQETALQNLPITFMLDRAGLTGPDGPTHHGMFDLGYMRILPNMTVMAPGDAWDLAEMVPFAIAHNAPISMRYPKASVKTIEGPREPVELGKSEVIQWGDDGCIICCGTQLYAAIVAAESLREDGFDIGVVNARFVKPLDTETIFRAVEKCGFVLTLEEGALAGGFGSAVVEAVCDAGLDSRNIRRLGAPDEFISYGERSELLADLQLDTDGIVRCCREMIARVELQE